MCSLQNAISSSVRVGCTKNIRLVSPNSTAFFKRSFGRQGVSSKAFPNTLGAAALIAGDFARVQFAHDAVARPAVFEVFGFDEGVELVLRVFDVVGYFDQADAGKFAKLSASLAACA